MKHPLFKQLDGLLHSSVDHKNIFGIALSVESGDQRLIWTGSAGNMNADSPFFIASTTKLFITASILKLKELKKIRF